MSNAYHVVVNALEAKAGWTPMARFASAVAHAINGHLPYQRYHAAGVAAKRSGMGAGALESIVREFIATDLAPGVSMIRRLANESIVVAGYNAYNASAKLGVVTQVELAGAPEADRAKYQAARTSVVEAEDPELCRLGTILVFEALHGQVAKRALQRDRPLGMNLTSVAGLLGVERSVAAEAALVLETEGQLTIAQLAGRMGCHQRTLERRLKESGLTPEMLRQASRLVRAHHRLFSQDSLTTIAVDEGFSDLAHMTRSFQTAGGMAPSMLRKLAHADLAASRMAAP